MTTINALSAEQTQHIPGALRSVPVVLSDFELVVLTESRAQDELKKIQVHFMSIAQAAKRGISDERERLALHEQIAARMTRFGTSSEYIAQRQVSVLSSYFVKHEADSSGSKLLYGDLRTPTGELLDARMTLFEEIAGSVFARLYDEATQPPEEIVHVTCSGYVSPSPVQVYLSQRGWHETGVTHSYHMGCYGAFPAVRTAVGLVGSSYVSLRLPKRRVDLVHTEFLS
ncbi:MAG: hypothetical protein JO092_03975, partial [Candidatus Eremiobacteraeota bacterium]|nr:hypothetical protein [Candidatus Eremiobacteraeota bacterium]